MRPRGGFPPARDAFRGCPSTECGARLRKTASHRRTHAEYDKGKWKTIDGQVYWGFVREATLETISAPMPKGDDLSPEVRALLDLMVVLVECFEANHSPVSNAPPVEVLCELLESNGLKQKDLVPEIGSKGVASEFFSGKRALSKQQAKALDLLFGVSPGDLLVTYRQTTSP